MKKVKTKNTTHSNHAENKKNLIFICDNDCVMNVLSSAYRTTTEVIKSFANVADKAEATALIREVCCNPEATFTIGSVNEGVNTESALKASSPLKSSATNDIAAAIDAVTAVVRRLPSGSVPVIVYIGSGHSDNEEKTFAAVNRLMSCRKNNNMLRMAITPDGSISDEVWAFATKDRSIDKYGRIIESALVFKPQDMGLFSSILESVVLSSSGKGSKINQKNGYTAVEV